VKVSANEARSAHAATIESSHSIAGELGVRGRQRQLGGVVLTETVFPAESVITFDDTGAESYFVHLPIVGRAQSRYLGAERQASREAAFVHQPNSGPVHGWWAAGTHCLCASLRRSSVQGALTSLLGEPPATAIRFDPTMRTADARARTWVDLMARVNRDLADADGLAAQPLVAESLAESLVAGFLFAARHSYSDMLATPVAAARPRVVQIALELIEADPAAPWTVAMLAESCGVSVRALQHGFRRHLGTSPMGHLRDVRLRRAHEELRAGDPFSVSVADIARKWGFRHAGRFAGAHQAEYGESPLCTLRSSR
jgi:AraC-like DNA-binding protein